MICVREDQQVGRTETSIPKVPFAAPNHRQKWIFLVNQKMEPVSKPTQLSFCQILDFYCCSCNGGRGTLHNGVPWWGPLSTPM